MTLPCSLMTCICIVKPHQHLDPNTFWDTTHNNPCPRTAGHTPTVELHTSNPLASLHQTTYRCSRCRCTRRSGARSSPCRRQHTGQCPPAASYALEQHNTKHNNNKVGTTHYYYKIHFLWGGEGVLYVSLVIAVHTCVYIVPVGCFSESFHSCNDEKLN